jgi:MFS family permease
VSWAAGQAMDIGGSYAGVGAGMMNTGFGVAGIISPFAFGALVQATGTWSLPFLLSAVLLVAGALGRTRHSAEARSDPRRTPSGGRCGADYAATVSCSWLAI